MVVNKEGLVVASVSTFLPLGAPTTSAFTEHLAVLLAAQHRAVQYTVVTDCAGVCAIG